MSLRTTPLPADHPLRLRLNDEVHARPPEALATPSRISHLAMLSPAANRDRERRMVGEWAARFGVAGPVSDASHYSEDFGAFRLKWERHTEFTRYTFIVSGDGGDAPFVRTALEAAPREWLAGLPGETIAAVHVALLKPVSAAAIDEIAARSFRGNVLLGATLGDGVARAFADFRIHDDGFSRILIEDRSMSSRQAGRMVQRMLEIETYRVVALLALPVAQAMQPFQSQCEADLARITHALSASQPSDEAALLERLTRLEAEIESRGTETDYRFSAAVAYYDLVRRRIAELREGRIEGHQTFGEFIERRLAPAVATCRTVAARQRSLSERVSRSTQLLSTRVDLTRERQNQALLESMNRRQALQLRLQSTVEGLSIAAITYYIVGLVGYAAKALKAAGAPLDPDITMGASIPLVALAVALGVRRIRKAVAH